MSNVRIRHRSSTSAEWNLSNPILAAREIAFEHPSTGIGTGKVKVKQGDGVTSWRDLPYCITGDGGGSSGGGGHVSGGGNSYGGGGGHH